MIVGSRSITVKCGWAPDGMDHAAQVGDGVDSVSLMPIILLRESARVLTSAGVRSCPVSAGL